MAPFFFSSVLLLPLGRLRVSTVPEHGTFRRTVRVFPVIATQSPPSTHALPFNSHSYRIIMEDFGPISKYLLDFLPAAIAPPHLRINHEGRRWVRQMLRLLNQQSHFHDRPYTWGFTIFRTIYTPDSDERFARAVEELNQLAREYVFDDLSGPHEPGQEPFDPRPNEELARRFYCDVIQDAATLDGATPDELGRRFDALVAGHL